MEVESKPRERLLQAAARLLAETGTTVSTRAICDAAGVTAPTLYHYFGDRDGLLQAVVSQGFSDYLEGKRRLEETGDPIRDIQLGWDDHVAWGVEHPAFYALMYGQVRPGHHAEAADEAAAMLLDRLEAAARKGLLRVPPHIAMRMILAANVGLTLLLISQPDAASDDLSRRLRDATLDGITRPTAELDRIDPWSTPVSAIALRASLKAGEGSPLEPAEQQLFEIWLDRLAAAGSH